MALAVELDGSSHIQKKNTTRIETVDSGNWVSQCFDSRNLMPVEIRKPLWERYETGWKDIPNATHPGVRFHLTSAPQTPTVISFAGTFLGE